MMAALGLGSRLANSRHCIERVMDAMERAVPSPQVKIVVHRAARRQVLRDRSPLATGAQHIHQAIDHLAHIDRALVAASLGWRNQRLALSVLRSSASLLLISCLTSGMF